MQIIKFSWKGFEPALTMSDGSCEPLLGRRVAMRVGEKKCIGYRRKGVRHECPNGATATGYYCNRCALSDDFFLCVRCRGDECINRQRREDCKKEEYLIYLAAFDRLVKVGITQQHRFLERLVEQGADFAAKIGSVRDGKDVRSIEQKISSELAITDRVIGKEKHTLLFADPNAAMGSILSAMKAIQGNGFAAHLIAPEIYDLRRYYCLENVTAKPRYTEPKAGMQIEGEVAAAKGNLIIFRADGFFSINAHRLIGREVFDFRIS